MISQDWCYNKRKLPAGATAPVVWIERQENNMHISYKPLWHTLLERDMRKEYLTIKRGAKVWIKVPQKGQKREMLEMVKNNAQITLEKFKDKYLIDKEINKIALEELQELLDLEIWPSRIEAYDISNIQGVDSVGSMIVFEEGRSKNSDYRRFRIKTVKGANDYDSMREILTRRFSHGLEEVKAIQESKLQFSAGKFSNFPDLIMMDGGKGR